MSKVLKRVEGTVEQIFEDGKCISQEFFAGDEISFCDENYNTLDYENVLEELYHPFDMVQPTLT